MFIQDGRAIMRSNGMKCVFHMPPALVPKFNKKGTHGLWMAGDDVNNRGDEIVQPLPPGSPRFAYSVDEYQACPSNWMNGSAKASSYWLPVRPGCGMWLDFNYAYEHSHHVAVVVSIQGVNPITGQQTKQLRLEQYQENCPVHNVAFGQDRYCEQCGYKWDAQNYIASNCTPRGLFWIDGFRGGDGTVRQYIFTEETCKGVAANIIGEDRVFAIGVAFYLSREPKPVQKVSTSDFGTPMHSTHGYQLQQAKLFPCIDAQKVNKNKRIYKSGIVHDQHTEDMQIMAQNPQLLSVAMPSGLTQAKEYCPVGTGFPNDDALALQQLASGDGNLDMFYSQQISPTNIDVNIPPIVFPCIDTQKVNKNKRIYKSGIVHDQHTEDMDFEYSPAESGQDKLTPEEIEKEMKKLEITAGARIRQQIFHDPEQLSFWQDEPHAMLYINYVDVSTAEKIINSGRKQRSESYLDTLSLS